MRILYNSKDKQFKTPFGTLTEGQKSNISIHIPASCKTKKVKLVFLYENKEEYAAFSMSKTGETADYEIFSVDFSLALPNLYFYYFRITTENESFSLFREGYDMTNMESGELWQLSVIPADFKVPDGYAGGVMYQIFPDRFNSVGDVNLTYKLEPFWFHEDMSEIPDHLPNNLGVIDNSDFFGGNLRGIAAKLDYLAELGVKLIYLNPIFKAASNHRYDTSDYMKIDEALGTEEDFIYLCEEAHKRGIRIILDGVFSHTGSDSRYFDIKNRYGDGAYHDPNSRYRSWYSFKHYPDDYTSWWGIETLPCTNENDKGFCDFIFGADDSVLAHWLSLGADGFRLDVADELPDSFITAFRARLKEIKPDALLLGEVWEDASNKISYGKRRRYFTDGELDSVMNYPYRNAIIDFVTGKDNGVGLSHTVMEIAENYPEAVVLTLMNMLSTHDTVRILSLLSPEKAPDTKDERAAYRMPREARTEAIARLCAATFLQFMLPGMPCIFYGDEIGTEGFEDPFCRSYFRWDDVPDNPLLDFFKKLATIRNKSEMLKYGNTDIKYISDGAVMLERTYGAKSLCAYVNVGSPLRIHTDGDVIFAEKTEKSGDMLTLDRYGFALVE